MQPLVSVIVDSYNYARYVAEAIESALGQDYPRVEVIVVDDGSTDRSPEVIAGYADRARTILKENGGQASALNAGFAASRGDIVIFCDSDDFLFPNAVASVVAAWRAGCAKVQFRLAIVDAEGRRTGTIPAAELPLPSGDVVPIIAAGGAYLYPPTTGNAFARPTLEALMPIPEADFRLSPDGYLNSLAPFHGEVVSIPDEIGAYRLHGENRWIGLSSARELRRHVEHDVLKERYILDTARAQGRVLPPDLSLRDFGQAVHRLCHLRVDPAGPVVGSDTRLGLALACVRAALRSPQLAGLERLLQSAVVVAIALAPRPLARRLVAWELTARPRPAILRLARRAMRRIRLPMR